MKVCIPYKTAGPELKYCLRGIEKYISDPEVIIIGDNPGFKNVEHIPFRNATNINFKAKNIYEKLMLVNDDFLFFNDDHFLLKPFDKEIYHYSGTIRSKLESMPAGLSYRLTLVNTLVITRDLKNFDTHCPIYYKRNVLEYLSLYDWSKPGGYCIKSLYAFSTGIEGTQYPDLKIIKNLPEDKIKELINDRPYFSTSDNAMSNSMINVLEEIYPTKSIFEHA